jgi:hypothetical protein
MVPQQQIYVAKDNLKNLAGPVSIPNIWLGPRVAGHAPAPSGSQRLIPKIQQIA